MTTHLEREIGEQAQVLRDRTEQGAKSAARAVELLSAGDVSHLVIAARGSSDNAARFAQYLLGQELGIQVALAAPSLYTDPRRSPRLRGAAVIGISQSGMSPDIVQVLASARLQRRPTIAITNSPSSPLADQADVVVPLSAGTEQSVAATKTYMASLHAVLQIAQAMVPHQERQEWIERLPDLIGAQSRAMLETRNRFDAIAQMRLITATGRGLAFSAACETALKIRELSGIPSEAFSPPDLIHGPIAALDGSGGGWLVEPNSVELELMLARTTLNVVVSISPPQHDERTIGVQLPAGPAWTVAFLAVIVAQAAGLRIAELRHRDIDAPGGLSKVTLTT